MSDSAPEPSPAPDAALPNTPTTHSDFRVPQDIVLRSSDLVLFNIARHDLERTSKWFRGMFESSSRTSSSEASEEIPVFEDAGTLEVVLKAALGLKIGHSALNTIEACDAAYRAAEKYEMEGVMESMQLRLWRALLRAKDPALQYIYACRHGFDELRDEAFDRCSRMDIDYSKLKELGGSDFSRLIIARTQRTNDIHTILGEAVSRGALCHAENNGQCGCCRCSLGSTHRLAWNSFVRIFMQRSVHIPDVERLFADPAVIPAYEAVRVIICPNNKLPFGDFKEQLLSAFEQRQTQRSDLLQS